ncbi:hypothetical protein [Leifsonia poae]
MSDPRDDAFDEPEAFDVDELAEGRGVGPYDADGVIEPERYDPDDEDDEP